MTTHLNIRTQRPRYSSLLTATGYPIRNDVTVYRSDYSVAYTTDTDSTGRPIVDSAGNPIIGKWINSAGNWSPGASSNISDYVNGASETNPEMAFTIDPNSGRINFAFDVPSNGQALGFVNTLSPYDIDGINNNFHSVYSADRGSAVRSAQLITSNSKTDSNVANPPRIVPGSETVWGPNITPGPNYGTLVRYERVPIYLGDAGLNQYKLDYDTGEIFFSPIYDQDVPGATTGLWSPPGTLNPLNPPGPGIVPITIDYKIHFNLSDDIVRGDYTTKSLVRISLGMIIFDPESGNPHEVDISDSIKVRNAVR